ncbi:MAG: DNA polymerase III subunit chi [Rhodospirillaceae bacterium]|jgi:DNA polymerase III subunit chi|nr:DNA polymerase III subunit chi [Rhodospirillaceae bacterium]MBT6117847.1 DNA polymerase III subunit chi [Rhodospirillaceae bacterium]
MTEIRFYHLQRKPLERALPELLEKVLERGSRAVVMAASEERVEALAGLLWTYDDRGFLPHGTARDGRAEHQPIWLTQGDENPNGADVLILTDGAETSALGDYSITCELFDGNDPDAVSAARGRWTGYKEAGHDLTYWQQTARGGWEKKA